MSLFSNARRLVDRARGYAAKNPRKVQDMTDKAARFADQRTKGKYRRQIDQAVRKVDGITGQDRRRDDGYGPGPGGPGQGPQGRY